jgi:hypothetical protein
LPPPIKDEDTPDACATLAFTLPVADDTTPNAPHAEERTPAVSNWKLPRCTSALDRMVHRARAMR